MDTILQLYSAPYDASVSATLYRILTEHKNVDGVKEWLAAHRIDYTLFIGDGAWKGVPEACMAIELAGTARADAIKVALAVKAMNEQEAILVQEIPVVSMFL